MAAAHLILRTTGAEAVRKARRDRPLHGQPHPADKLHPSMYAAEFLGTALMVSGGLSIVIALFGAGSPLSHLIDPLGLRRAFAGFLFGSVGMLVALSPLGKISGAHINPAVTFAFWLEGKVAWRDALGYAAAQLAGGVAGAALLLAWGPLGKSLDYGASLPALGVMIWWPLLGEVIGTYLLVAIIFFMAAHRSTQPFAPFTNPPLYSLLVWLEGPLSGASTNPARSIGLALVSGQWHGQWIYFAGPCLGAAVAVAAFRFEAMQRHRPEEARRFHFTAQHEGAD